jgi:hypothetical protein
MRADTIAKLSMWDAVRWNALCFEPLLKCPSNSVDAFFVVGTGVYIDHSLQQLGHRRALFVEPIKYFGLLFDRWGGHF